jgi:hypothetical protein
MAESPFGETDAFPDIWKRTEALLTSYDDEQFVHDQYARELNTARTQATEVEDVSDDPDDRIAAWLATVDNPALRTLDFADDIHVTGPLDPADFNVDPLDYL